MMIKSVDKALFDSSNLKAGLYRPHKEKLYLQFHGGEAIYEYDDVPLGVWKELKDAESHGSYFNSQIRGRYNHRRLTK